MSTDVVHRGDLVPDRIFRFGTRTVVTLAAGGVIVSEHHTMRAARAYIIERINP